MKMFLLRSDDGFTGYEDCRADHWTINGLFSIRELAQTAMDKLLAGSTIVRCEILEMTVDKNN